MSGEPTESLVLAEEKVALLEQMIEGKTRELSLANEKLRAANDYLTELYHVMPNALLMVTETGEIRQVNRAALELLNYTEAQLKGRNIAAVSVDAARALSQEDTCAESTKREEWWLAATGDKLPVLVSCSKLRDEVGRIRSIVFVGVDLRAHKRLEIELRHAQKLEAIGQLAAGIAHEINTPMQFIGDNVVFLQEAFTDLISLVDEYERIEADGGGSNRRSRDSLNAIRERADLEYLRSRAPKAFETTLVGVDRVSGIVSAMKAFSHPETQKSLINLNTAVETTLTVTKAEYKYVADVDFRPGDVPLVLCRGRDINQVLVNLIVNAAHAISDKNGANGPKGRIVVATRPDDDHVVLSVSDSGGGIPEEIRHRIFDPFFTTKEVGRGTGQGLTISYNIVVERHGGTLTFETELGQGTTFFVRLPIDGAPGRRGLTP
ncbi:MAG TPA: ATP-binding protein [Polyangiales bacterium]